MLDKFDNLSYKSKHAVFFSFLKQKRSKSYTEYVLCFLPFFLIGVQHKQSRLSLTVNFHRESHQMIRRNFFWTRDSKVHVTESRGLT